MSSRWLWHVKRGVFRYVVRRVTSVECWATCYEHATVKGRVAKFWLASNALALADKLNVHELTKELTDDQ